MSGLSGVFDFANNFKTTLAAPINSAGQTNIQLVSTAGFPTLKAGQIMSLTLNDAATGSVYEVVYVTAINGNTLTVKRGQENTTALPQWNTGDKAYAAASAGTLASFAQIQLPSYGQGGALIKAGPINVALTPGTPYAFPFPVPFPNQLFSVVCGITTALNSGDLTNYGYHTDNETAIGFNITVTGGNPLGPTVNAWYIAVGN